MRAYRILLRFFPPHVRRQDGDEMEALFARQHARVHGVARLHLWLRATGDAVRHGIGGRFDQMRRRPQRKERAAVSPGATPAPGWRRWWMDTFRYDVRHAWRLLARQPGLTATIVITLALGIGANTAVFSVVHAVLLRPLPYTEPERLVMVWEKRPAEGVMNNTVSPADFLDWVRTSQSFSGLAGYTAATIDLTGVGDPVQLPTAGVTAGFFDVLGVRALHGRTFAPREDSPGRDGVVLISRPGQSAVGKRVRFNGGNEPWREVVGVITDVKHWGLDREVNPEMYLTHDQFPWSSLTYVLHATGDAAALVTAVTAHVKEFDADLPLGAVRTMDAVAARSMAARRWSALLLGMFAVLGLVQAAAGIYGVMAHIVSMRTGEIGIRMTLGARPAGVLAQVLGEALLQTGVGLAIGLLVAVAAMRGLSALLFEVTATDPTTFVGAVVTVLGMAGLAALVPAVRAMRVDPVRALRSE